MRAYEGYRPLAVDITAFWRPQLQFWQGKFFHRLANKAVKGIGFGVVTQIGEVDGQRLPLLKRIIRVQHQDDGEATLKATVLRQIRTHLDETEVFVHDAGVSIAEVQAAGIPRFVIHLVVNCTGRRNYLPPKKKRGRRAEYGQVVRPLLRRRVDNDIPATPPDVTTRFQFAGRTIEVQGWQELVRADQKVADTDETFTIRVFADPLYQHPLVIGANLPAQPEAIF